MKNCICFSFAYGSCICKDWPEVRDFTVDSGIGIFKVEYIDFEGQDEGELDIRNKTISIPNKGTEKDKAESLLHELNHLALHMSGMSRDTQDELLNISEEMLVSAVTNMWIILEKLNPGLMARIGSSLNV